jgi:hypothetical protein
MSDALCLWHLCPRAACRRQARCRGRDAVACLERLAPLAPEEARLCLIGRIVTHHLGLSHAEADAVLVRETPVLDAWTAACHAAHGRSRRRGGNQG